MCAPGKRRAAARRAAEGRLELIERHIAKSRMRETPRCRQSRHSAAHDDHVVRFPSRRLRRHAFAQAMTDEIDGRLLFFHARRVSDDETLHRAEEMSIDLEEG